VSNDSVVIDNVIFQSFQTLRLRHLRKYGQQYRVVACHFSIEPKIHKPFYIKFCFASVGMSRALKPAFQAWLLLNL